MSQVKRKIDTTEVMNEYYIPEGQSMARDHIVLHFHLLCYF